MSNFQFQFNFLIRKLSHFSIRNIHTLNYDKLIIENINPIQRKLLDEMCIVVDKNDRPLGSKSKKDCHLMMNIRQGLIHRAFSVFLFNSKNELLLQQRSCKKITFPDYYTNTCCSHPLYLDLELEKENAIGIKRAAARRLEFELGIQRDCFRLEDFHYMTRILYTAASDDIWGENEIDYILILQKDVEVKQNPNEVAETCYVSRQDLPDFLQSLIIKGCRITPWFNMVVNNFLYTWWDNLHQLEELKDHKSIHTFKD